MNAFPLIRRKLTPARMPDPYVRRQKLVSQLQLGLEPSRRLTVVCGGPGYGKSTLVAAYLQETELPACWYALEDADADLTTFLTYLVGTLAARFPAVGGRVMELVRSAPALEPVLQTIIGLLAEELAEVAEDGAVLVLDDFHAVHHIAGIAQATEFLVQYLPDNWQLVLTTREQPNLTLPQLRVRQQLVELGVRELRFAPGELRELLQRLCAVDLSDAEALELVGHTDGWVASVILAAQAVRGGSGEEAKALLMRELVQPAALYDYLATEVFSRQDPTVQTFLLETSLLPTVDANGCRDALGHDDVHDRIRHLIQNNLLLPEGPEPANGRNEGHAYHPSFRRFLLDRLEETIPAERFAGLCRRVGAYLAPTQPEEGLALLMRAHDLEGAARLLAGLAERLIANNQLDRLRAAIERFEPAFALTSFELSFYEGEVQRLWGNFDRALGLFSRAQALAAGRGDDGARGLALVHQAAIWLGRGDPEAMVLLGEGEALLAPADLPGRAFAHNLRGAWAFTTNLSQQALDSYERSLACYRQHGDPVGQAKVLNNLGIVYTRHGQFTEALATYHEAIRQSELAGRYPHPMVLNNLASIHLYQGSFQAAWDAAERALDLAQLLKARRDGLFAHLCLGLANAALGDARRAEEHFASARDGALAMQDKATAAKAYAGLAELALTEGRQARALALLEQGIALAGLPLEDPRQGDLAILLGLLRLESGECAGAGALLDRLEREFDALQYRYRQAQVTFYQARLAVRLGDRPRSDERWAAAETLAQAHGYAHLLAQEQRHRWVSDAGPANVTVSAVIKAPERPALAHAITIQLFGDVAVTVGDRLVTNKEWRGFKTKLILAFLLGHPEGVTKDQLTDLLYGEMDTSRTATLVLISRLRHALEPQLDKQTPSRFVHFLDGRYTFNFALPYQADTQDFAHHCKRGADAELPLAERREHWRAALGIHAGPFLAELAADCPWMTVEQERYRRLAQGAHTALIQSYMAEADHAAALRAAEANLAFDACAELAHQVKMLCLSQLGQRETALRHYGLMKQVFERELASPPSRASQMLYEQISQGQEVAWPEGARRGT